MALPAQAAGVNTILFGDPTGSYTFGPQGSFWGPGYNVSGTLFEGGSGVGLTADVGILSQRSGSLTLFVTGPASGTFSGGSLPVVYDFSALLAISPFLMPWTVTYALRGGVNHDNCTNASFGGELT